MTLQNWSLGPDTVDNLGLYEYKESKDTGKESFAPGSSSLNRVFYVNWQYHIAFLDDLLGYSYLTGNNSINRVLPDIHPLAPAFIAMDAQVEPTGPASVDLLGNPAFPAAKITATYKAPDYAATSDYGIQSELDRYVTRQYSFAQEYLTLQGNLRWVSRPAHDAIQAVAGMTIGTMEMVYTWKEVPALPSDPFRVPNLKAIKNCMGKVNSKAFDSNHGNYAAGTVLFVGVEPRMITPRLHQAIYYWEIQMKFLLRDNGPGVVNGDQQEEAGHNYIYDPINQRWDKVTTDGQAGSPSIYQSADLNTLFEVDS